MRAKKLFTAFTLIVILVVGTLWIVSNREKSPTLLDRIIEIGANSPRLDVIRQMRTPGTAYYAALELVDRGSVSSTEFELTLIKAQKRLDSFLLGAEKDWFREKQIFPCRAPRNVGPTLHLYPETHSRSAAANLKRSLIERSANGEFIVLLEGKRSGPLLNAFGFRLSPKQYTRSKVRGLEGHRTFPLTGIYHLKNGPIPLLGTAKVEPPNSLLEARIFSLAQIYLEPPIHEFFNRTTKDKSLAPYASVWKVLEELAQKFPESPTDPKGAYFAFISAVYQKSKSHKALRAFLEGDWLPFIRAYTANAYAYAFQKLELKPRYRMATHISELTQPKPKIHHAKLGFSLGYLEETNLRNFGFFENIAQGYCDAINFKDTSIAVSLGHAHLIPIMNLVEKHSKKWGATIPMRIHMVEAEIAETLKRFEDGIEALRKRYVGR